MPRKSVRNLVGLVLLILLIPTLVVIFSLSKNNISSSVEGVTTANFIHLTPAEFNNSINNSEENAVIIDLRSPEEYQLGHIESSINLPFSSPEFTNELVKLDKQKIYHLYCRNGSESIQVLKQMKELGFTNVLGLAGGLNAWSAVFSVTD